MRAAIGAIACLAVAGCQHLSYVDPEFSDTGGVMAAEITDAVLRSGNRTVHVIVPEQSDHALSVTVPASLQGAGVAVDETGPELRYYITKLYGGILMRVKLLNEWTARFFVRGKGGIEPAGPVTIRKDLRA